MRTRLDARLAYATTAVGVSAVSLIAPVLPELAALYRVDVGDVAAMHVAVLAPGILSARWLLGRGADAGLHRMLGVALLGYGFAGASLVALSSFPLVLLVRAIQGFFCGGLVAGAFALLSAGGAGREHRIARNAALVCAMMAIQPLLGSALSLLGPRGPFLFYLAGAPLGVTMLRVGSRRQGADAAPLASRAATAAAAGSAPSTASTGPSPESAASDPVRPVAAALPPGSTTVAESLITTVVINGLLFGWLLYLAPVYLSSAFDLGVSLRGVVLSAQAALGAVLALAVAGLLRRGRQRALLYAGLAVPVLGLATVVLSRGPVLAITGFLLVGFTYGTANPAVVSILTARGRRATGAWQSSARVGQVVGPAVAGWLITRRDVDEVVLIGVVLGALGFLGLALPDLLRRRMAASGEADAPTDPRPT